MLAPQPMGVEFFTTPMEAKHGSLLSANQDVTLFLTRGISFFRESKNGVIFAIFTCRCPNRSGVGAIDSPD